jgi:hypothetical protein
MIMGDPDGCPVCEGEQRTTWMFTHLAPPATVQSCEEHANINLITLLAIRLNVDQGWLYEKISDAVNAKADEHDKQAAAAERKAKRQAAKSAKETADELQVDAENAAEYAAQAEFESEVWAEVREDGVHAD